MGIVTKALWRSSSGLGWRPRVDGGLLRAGPALESCAPRLRQGPGLERAAFPVGEIDRQRGAGAGIAVRYCAASPAPAAISAVATLLADGSRPRRRVLRNPSGVVSDRDKLLIRLMNKGSDLARPPHHRPPDGAVHELPTNPRHCRCRRQSRHQHGDWLSDRE